MSNITNLTRPTSFEEVVGMDAIKTIILLDIRGAKIRNLTPPNFILAGPAGSGKTTIAELIGGEMGGEVHKYLGSDIKSPDDVIEIAAQVKDGDVVYIEEAHTIGGGTKNSRYTQAVFLEWMENGKIINSGAFVGLTAPKVAFVLPTTSPGLLSEPFRTRCRILTTKYYTVDELSTILTRAAKKLNIDLSTDTAGLRLLAQSSRGSPRIAIMNRLNGLANLMAVENTPFSLDVVRRFMAIYDISEWGLETGDILYCKTLYQKFADTQRPVALKTMQQLTGMSEDMIREVIENYLIHVGIISVESRGRILTDFGCNILGLTPIKTTGLERLIANNSSEIDLNHLNELVQDKELCRGGMRGFAEILGLNYPGDNSRLQAALNIIGYESRQRVGVIPKGS